MPGTRPRAHHRRSAALFLTRFKSPVSLKSRFPRWSASGASGMDHLRDMDGMWQSQVVVPKALRPIIGKANFIRAVGIENTGPMSRKKAAASAIHLAFVADAKSKIDNARAQLTRQQFEPWGRFVDVSTTSMTAVDPDRPITVPDGAHLVTHNGRQFLTEYRTLPQPADVARVVECAAVIEQWTKKDKEAEGPPKPQAITAMRTAWIRFFTWLYRDKPDAERHATCVIAKSCRCDLLCISPEDVAGYKEHLIARRYDPDDNGINTLNTAYDQLRQITGLLTFAHDTGKIPTNPGKGISIARRSRAGEAASGSNPLFEQ